ncbi:alpha/beta hydrolase [Flavobacterium sp. NST-5]|uniref:Alpha/beta hydrolase n=1 Tax=Flavobacterium ichthyis TaxID=2698827 RepID=A0ABW9ZCL6_9FLAO|nr:acyl-CoA thioester hydrolase/BAAT C-terminal domain-containing protein [Flavobacterium ichthyis]NBL65067.1 alpha/beta hydrolase [Flavobacterium ichthyis]
MKYYILFLIHIFFWITANAQGFKGKWSGLLNVNGMPLRLQFTIDEFDGHYSAQMASVDQNIYGIPVSIQVVDSLNLILDVDEMGINYQGRRHNDKINGTFRQGNLKVEMNLSSIKNNSSSIERFQTPAPPYHYHTEEVVFFNTSANIRLAGTLTLPKKKGKFPIAILISGSGPQNRDQEVFGHKPFFVIADYLTSRGIGVLRFDDRGVAGSEGIFSQSTISDFANDVESAIFYLRSRADIKKNKIGLIGHSEGAVMGQMVAAKDKKIQFLAMLAGFGLPGQAILLKQQETIAQSLGVPQAEIIESIDLNRKLFNAIKHGSEDDALKHELFALIENYYKTHPLPNLPAAVSKDAFLKQQVERITTPWMLEFIKLDPATYLKKINCSVLALNGEKDVQIETHDNVEAIGKVLLKSNIESKIYSDLNHLLQTCKTGMMDEYATLEETISPKVLMDLNQWIQKKI